MHVQLCDLTVFHCWVDSTEPLCGVSLLHTWHSLPVPSGWKRRHRECARWVSGVGGGAGVREKGFSVYILILDDSSLPWFLLLKLLIINFGDRGLECLTRGKCSLNICSLFNTGWYFSHQIWRENGPFGWARFLSLCDPGRRRWVDLSRRLPAERTRVVSSQKSWLSLLQVISREIGGQ